MRFQALLIICLCYPTLSAQIPNDSTSLRVHVEQMPFFAGCEHLPAADPARRRCSDEKLAAFIEKYLIYPDSAVQKGISGSVIVAFTVDETGRAIDSLIVRDIGGGCGQAALDIVRAMPRWEPGLHEGKKVKTRLTLPVRFFFKPQATETGENYSIHWGPLRGDKVKKTVLRRCAEEQLYVRDDYGNAVQVNDLRFSFEKKRKVTEAHTTGSLLDKKMKHVVQKASSGGTFSISATVQRSGRFIVVQKIVEVEE